MTLTTKKKGYNLTKGGEGCSGLIHTDETKKKMAMAKKKHDAEKGCINFHKRHKKWRVISACPQKHIGLYNTKERATEALNFYNEKKETLPSDLSTRRNGTGSITFNKRQKKWRVRSGSPRKHIGYYYTKEKAIEALNIYNKSGKKMPSDKKNI